MGISQVYKKDWVSWPDFLGYGEGKPKRGTFLVFEEAREVAMMGTAETTLLYQMARDARGPTARRASRWYRATD